MYEITEEQKQQLQELLESKDKEILSLKIELNDARDAEFACSEQIKQIQSENETAMRELEQQTKLLKESDSTLGLVLNRLRKATDRAEMYSLVNKNHNIKVQSIDELLNIVA